VPRRIHGAPRLEDVVREPKSGTPAVLLCGSVRKRPGPEARSVFLFGDRRRSGVVRRPRNGDSPLMIERQGGGPCLPSSHARTATHDIHHSWLRGQIAAPSTRDYDQIIAARNRSQVLWKTSSHRAEAKPQSQRKAGHIGRKSKDHLEVGRDPDGCHCRPPSTRSAVTGVPS